VAVKGGFTIKATKPSAQAKKPPHGSPQEGGRERWDQSPKTITI
jgi:hypothetical protein